MRTVRLGLLGLGTVGQAVVRTLGDARVTLARQGLGVEVAMALVRDPCRRRALDRPPLLTRNIDDLLGAGCDVVVEVLGGESPAADFIARILAAGVPVVSANKTVVACRGAALHRIARAHGTEFRYEASVIAGVPFLGALAGRPLAGSVRRVVGVLNGTSNFVLNEMAGAGVSFGTALARAQALGFAEPDPSRDVEGLDARDKLVVLLGVMGRALDAAAPIETEGIGRIDAFDLDAARRAGGALRPLAYAALDGPGVEAFIGPAFVADHHPLAGLPNAENGLCVDGAFQSGVCFRGPGAGPSVTAATIVDDVVEAVRGRPAPGRFGGGEDDVPLAIEPPATPWFVRIDAERGAVPGSAVAERLSAAGLAIRSLNERRTARTSRFHLFLDASRRCRVERALAGARAALPVVARAFRALE